MAPSAAEEPLSPTSDGSYSAVCLGTRAAFGGADGPCYPPALPVRPRQEPWSNSHRPYPLFAFLAASSRGQTAVRSACSRGPSVRKSRASGRRNVAYVDRTLTCVDCRCRVRALGRRSGVLHAEGVRLGPETVSSCRAARRSNEGIAGRHGTTVSAVAVAWVLAWPGVTGAIWAPDLPSRSTVGSMAAR